MQFLPHAHIPVCVSKAGTITLLPNICIPHTKASDFCLYLELERETCIRVKGSPLTYSSVGGLSGAGAQVLPEDGGE